MAYREWWSLPEQELSLAKLRLATTPFKRAGITVGVGLVPGRSQFEQVELQEGRVGVYFRFAPRRAEAVLRSLDEGLATHLANELSLMGLEMDDPDAAKVIAISVYAKREGWDGPRMLLTDQARDNAALWPVACAIAHLFARGLKATLIEEQEPEGWDPTAVLTMAG